MPRRWSQIFRALVPSWRFFDDLGEAPTLWFRWIGADGHAGEWTRALSTRERRGPAELLINPTRNTLFAAQSLLEQLLDEPDHPVSRALVENLVRTQGPPSGARELEVRLRVGEADALLSPRAPVHP